MSNGAVRPETLHSSHDANLHIANSWSNLVLNRKIANIALLTAAFFTGRATLSPGLDVESSGNSPIEKPATKAIEQSEFGRQLILTKEQRAEAYAREFIGVARQMRIDLQVPFTEGDITGLVGLKYSDITSNYGDHTLKALSTDLSFAGFIVDRFSEMGLKEGDKLLVFWSGSYPALNINVLAAAKAMGIEVTAVAVASSSNFGANIPGMTWLDIESKLLENGSIAKRATIASSIGGRNDCGDDIVRPGLLRETIEKYNIHFIDSRTVDEGIQQRLEIIDFSNFNAVVNIGGAAVVARDKEGFRMPIGISRPGEISPENFKPNLILEALNAGKCVLNLRHIKSTLPQEVLVAL